MPGSQISIRQAKDEEDEILVIRMPPEWIKIMRDLRQEFDVLRLRNVETSQPTDIIEHRGLPQHYVAGNKILTLQLEMIPRPIPEECMALELCIEEIGDAD